MTTLLTTGVVDVSGVVGALLRVYRNAGAGYAEQVKGDPAALRTAADNLHQQSRQSGTLASDTRQRIAALSSSWSGGAYDAYAARLKAVADQLDATASSLQKQGDRLTLAADALEHATQRMTALLADFDAKAQQLENEARTASLAAVPSFFVAAIRLGQSLLTAAQVIARDLDSQLSQLMAATDPPNPEWYQGIQNGFAIPKSSAELKTLLDQARASGQDPKQYAGLLEAYYRAKALERAGIDLSDWDTSQGAAANRDIVDKVYAYYGKLYLDHPYMEWAGMANMIGPTFAGGMFDINSIRSVANAASLGTGSLPDWARNALPFPMNGVADLAHASDSELGYFENKFLSMQQKIFLDQAPMHEAYLEGGLPAVQEMQQAGLINPDMTQAWSQIDAGRQTGDTTLLDQGNAALLHREQFDIIGQDYREMEAHDPPIGQAFTYAMSTVGTSSIPGTQTLAQYRPFSFTIDPPGPGQATVTTPFPDGNIADADTRWDLISHDTLPAYLDLIHNHPDQARAIISSDFEARTSDQRMLAQMPGVLDRLATNWDVRFGW